MKKYINIVDTISMTFGLAGCIIWIIGMAKRSVDIELSQSLRLYGTILLLVYFIINVTIRTYQKKMRNHTTMNETDKTLDITD